MFSALHNTVNTFIMFMQDLLVNWFSVSGTLSDLDHGSAKELKILTSFVQAGKGISSFD